MLRTKTITKEHLKRLLTQYRALKTWGNEQATKQTARLILGLGG